MQASRVALSSWSQGYKVIAEGQKAIQSGSGFIHRRMGDTVSSKVVPLVLSAAGAVVIVPGLFNMYLGRGKLE